MSEIKTALERFQSYCDSKGIPEKSSLAHIHKIDQFEEHERKDLRAAYGQQKMLIEALQKENAEQAKIIAELKNDEDMANAIIGKNARAYLDAFEKNATLKETNAAQAKRIEELELGVVDIRDWTARWTRPDHPIVKVADRLLSAQKGTE